MVNGYVLRYGGKNRFFYFLCFWFSFCLLGSWRVISAGLQTSKKSFKLFNYFKNKIFPNGILFLQETHSTKENEIKWEDEFDRNLYFSHAKSNSCGVLIGFSSNKTFTVKKRV